MIDGLELPAEAEGLALHPSSAAGDAVDAFVCFGDIRFMGTFGH